MGQKLRGKSGLPASIQRISSLSREDPLPGWACHDCCQQVSLLQPNAIAKKCHWILQGLGSRSLMDETSLIMLQRNRPEDLEVNLCLRSFLSSAHISAAANGTRQWKGQDASDTGLKEPQPHNLCPRWRKKTAGKPMLAVQVLRTGLHRAKFADYSMLQQYVLWKSELSDPCRSIK